MNDKTSGWVKLWRDQFHHEISERKPWCDGYAWSYLYARANHRAAIVNFRNQYLHVERGQLVTSKLKLQGIFGWSKKRVNSFLTSLEVGGMSTIRTTNRFIIITICNYDKFQSTEEEREPTEGTTEGPTESQQRATNKNIKKRNIYSQDSLEVLAYLNEKTGKHFRDSSTIAARLKDGGTIDDCRKIIDAKVRDPFFRDNPKHLNPTTLFRPSHWDKYLNEAAESAQRPDDLRAARPVTCPGCGRTVLNTDMEGAVCIRCASEARPNA